MKLKSKKIFIVWLFIALYLFSGLIFPMESAFSHNLYDTDIDYDYCESYQDNQADYINADQEDENEVEEVDSDCFLDSLQKSEKQCCIIQINRLNLENILSGFSNAYKIVLLDGNLHKKHIIDTCTTVDNTLAALKTVILLN